jgi:hypothetical protein
MKRSLIRFVLGISVLTFGGLVGSACSSDDAKPTTTNNSTVTDCYPVDQSCGLAGSKCQALIDNSSTDRKTLRMSQIRVVAPPTLASKPVQFTVLTPAIDLEAEKCYVGTLGEGGRFNWLIDFDVKTKKLITGGALPVDNPADGYCFYTGNINGIDVKPLETTVDFDEAKGVFKTDNLGDVTIPVFLDKTGTRTPILLPIHGGKLLDTTLTENGNCIGNFKGDTLQISDNCLPPTDNVFDEDAYQWRSGGELQGYITLEEADKVIIEDLNNQTLCRLLLGKGDPSNGNVCPRKADKTIDGEGDFDSNKDGIKDAVELKAQFAAAATKIKSNCP